MPALPGRTLLLVQFLRWCLAQAMVPRRSPDRPEPSPTTHLRARARTRSLSLARATPPPTTTPGESPAPRPAMPGPRSPRAALGVDPLARAKNSSGCTHAAARNTARAAAALHAFATCANRPANSTHSSGEYNAGSNDGSSRRNWSASTHAEGTRTPSRESQWFRGKYRYPTRTPVLVQAPNEEIS
jgi:hypothetical protein